MPNRPQDFFEILLGAHGRIDLPANELVDRLMAYYHLRAKNPDDFQEVWDLNRWARQRARLVAGQRLQQGLCTSCGKRKPAKGMRLCQQCRNSRRLYKQNGEAGKYAH